MANGDTITYTLVINNESDVTAQGVVVTDPVPVGTSYGTCTTPVGTTCGEGAGVVHVAARATSRAAPRSRSASR